MNLLIFGLGYSASAFVKDFGSRFEQIVGTHRQSISHGRLAKITCLPFDGQSRSKELETAILQADCLLISIPPQSESDLVLRHWHKVLKSATQLKKIVYLSTIGVYGDHQGAWIDETAAITNKPTRIKARIMAENAWLHLGVENHIPVHILRLAGIYGPGRNAIEDLLNGAARRIDKPGQVFNRIHVADIAQAIAAAFKLNHSDICNVVDDEPAPAPDVIAYAAKLTGQAPPPLIAYESAKLSPMAESFYANNRRITNRKLKEIYGVKLLFPTYRQGLSTIWQERS